MKGWKTALSPPRRHSHPGETLLDCIKTRRYTRARLSRLCAYALLNLTRDFAQTHRAPDLARVLGFRSERRAAAQTINQRSSIPLSDHQGRQF